MKQFQTVDALFSEIIFPADKDPQHAIVVGIVKQIDIVFDKAFTEMSSHIEQRNGSARILAHVGKQHSRKIRKA